MKCYSGLRSAWGSLHGTFPPALVLFVVRRAKRRSLCLRCAMGLGYRVLYRDAAVSAKKDSHVAKASVDRV